MKVYVVVGGFDYEGTNVLIVTGSKEEADECVAAYSHLDFVNVEEWRVKIPDAET